MEFQIQHHSFQRNPRADLLQNGLVGSPCSPRDSQESSPTPQFKSINSSVLSLFHSPTLTSIHDHRKNHSLDQTKLCWQSNVSAFEYKQQICVRFYYSLSCPLRHLWLESRGQAFLRFLESLMRKFTFKTQHREKPYTFAQAVEL